MTTSHKVLRFQVWDRQFHVPRDIERAFTIPQQADVARIMLDSLANEHIAVTGTQRHANRYANWICVHGVLHHGGDADDLNTCKVKAESRETVDHTNPHDPWYIAHEPWFGWMTDGLNQWYRVRPAGKK